MTTLKSKLFIYSIIVFLPFLLFYNVVPFLSEQTIGSDYLLFPIRYQMELLFSMKTGSFPLYVPGFAFGHSSSALTLGQVFHPLSHLASIMPGYWDGKAIEWNTLFKLLSLGLTQLVLFVFLQEIRLSRLFSFLLSFITVYNLKLLELFRHGPPMEAYTGHLVLCVAIGLYSLRPTKWTGPLSIIGATYILICSGHPEEMYYGLLGAGLFAFVAPFFISTMMPDREAVLKNAFGFWMKTGGCFLSGILLSSVYVLPFYFDFILDNTMRVGQSYAVADFYPDTFAGIINNFFLPLRSLVYQAFGGSSLILIAFILPIISLIRVKIPRSVWLIWGLLLFMFLFVLGSRTPVHRLAWEYLPFVSSIRMAGRISIIMPFFIMLLLAWVVQTEPFLLRFGRSSVTLRPAALLSYLSILLMVIYYLIYFTGYYILSLTMFKEAFMYPAGEFRYVPYFWLELMILITGISLLMAFAFYMRTGPARVLGLLLIVLTVVQVGLVLKYRTGHWIEKKYNSPAFQEMQRQKSINLDYSYYQGYGMLSSIVTKQMSNSFVEPYLGKIFTRIIPVNSNEEVYVKMQQGRSPQQVFIEGYSLERAEKISEGAKRMENGAVTLVYSSFNRLQFHVSSDAPAIFGLSYPFTAKWRAWINGERTQVYRANGSAHAVEIPEGESLIEFRYWSEASFWGMVISCATFAVIGLVVCFSGLSGLPRITGIIIILGLSGGGFTLWYNSLYKGDNLKTEYTWSYTPPLKTPNLAYGKKNWLSYCTVSRVLGARENELYRGRLVDGDTGPASGFTTRSCDNPAWFLDLYRIENIKIILLFKRSPDIPANIKPLTVAMSIDGSQWRTVASAGPTANHDGLVSIVFDRPETARLIKIEASGQDKLSFNEVEVYGPSEFLQTY